MIVIVSLTQLALFSYLILLTQFALLKLYYFAWFSYTYFLSLFSLCLFVLLFAHHLIKHIIHLFIYPLKTIIFSLPFEFLYQLEIWPLQVYSLYILYHRYWLKTINLSFVKQIFIFRSHFLFLFAHIIFSFLIIFHQDHFYINS